MHLVLTTVGSRGDVQPMLALALGLRAAGHHVQLCGPPEHKAWAAGLGLPYDPVGRDLQRLLTEHRIDPRHGLQSLKKVRDLLREEIVGQAQGLLPFARSADMLVGASAQLAAPSVAEAVGVPYRYVAFCPQVFDSRHHPPPVVPSANTPALVNLALWWIMNKVWRLSFGKAIDTTRAQLGLSPLQGNTYKHCLSSAPLVAADPELAPLPPDLEGHLPITGALRLGGDEALPPQLERWLSAGPAPIYVGFGSMVDEDPDQTLGLLSAFAARVGQRVLVQGGWTHLHEGQLGKGLHGIGPTPHGALFPRVAAVVHHGGAGTTTEAARAGVPQIVVPHGVDQPWWGARVQRMGLGPAPIHRRRLTEARLTAAWQSLCSDGGFAQRAAALGHRLQGTDGVAGAVAELERSGLTRR